MKLIFTFCFTSAVLIVSSVTDLGSKISTYFSAKKEIPFAQYHYVAGDNAAHVDSLVAACVAFKATLIATQITVLQQTFTQALAQNWSNLPCGSQCRNGLEFSTLTTAQQTAALNVIQIASGTVANEGYAEFEQIRIADSILNVNAGGGAYGKDLYFISFLNEPSTTSAWMLQYGGHHYAANIAVNNGIVVGATPQFEGVEPKSFVAADGNTYTPLNQEHDAMVNMLASLTTTELASAQLSTTFSDVLLGPNTDGNFPSTKQGIQVSSLTSAQQALVVKAMLPWVSDVNDITRDSLISIYTSELADTYIAWSTDATLASSTAYARIDGPSVWIEFVCQNGVVFSSQIHYHSVWRDHVRDYGNYLDEVALPLRITNFSGAVEGINRELNWATANEVNVKDFELQRSTNPMNSFSTIATIDAKNQTSNKYTYTDADKATANTYYYRLNMVDKDGKSSYSSIVKLTVRAAQALAAYPNPTYDKLNINLSTMLTNGTVRITSASGKEVLRSSNISGSTLSLNVSQLSAGIYFVEVNDNGNISRVKFVKSSD